MDRPNDRPSSNSTAARTNDDGSPPPPPAPTPGTSPPPFSSFSSFSLLSSSSSSTMASAQPQQQQQQQQHDGKAGTTPPALPGGTAAAAASTKRSSTGTRMTVDSSFSSSSSSSSSFTASLSPSRTNPNGEAKHTSVALATAAASNSNDNNNINHGSNNKPTTPVSSSTTTTTTTTAATTTTRADAAAATKPAAPPPPPPTPPVERKRSGGGGARGILRLAQTPFFRRRRRRQQTPPNRPLLPPPNHSSEKKNNKNDSEESDLDHARDDPPTVQEGVSAIGIVDRNDDEAKPVDARNVHPQCQDDQDPDGGNGGQQQPPPPPLSLNPCNEPNEATITSSSSSSFLGQEDDDALQLAPGRAAAAAATDVLQLAPGRAAPAAATSTGVDSKAKARENSVGAMMVARQRRSAYVNHYQNHHHHRLSNAKNGDVNDNKDKDQDEKARYKKTDASSVVATQRKRAPRVAADCASTTTDESASATTTVAIRTKSDEVAAAGGEIQLARAVPRSIEKAASATATTMAIRTKSDEVAAAPGGDIQLARAVPRSIAPPAAATTMAIRTKSDEVAAAGGEIQLARAVPRSVERAPPATATTTMAIRTKSDEVATAGGELQLARAVPRSVEKAAAATTTMAIRTKKSDDVAAAAGGEIQLARAVPRSHRFSVRGAAAAHERDRSHRKKGTGVEDTGPTLAPAASFACLVDQTDWTQLDTDVVLMGIDPKEEENDDDDDETMARKPAAAPKARPGSFPLPATSFREDRVQAKLLEHQQQQQNDVGPSLAPARHTSGGSHATSLQSVSSRSQFLPPQDSHNDSLDELALMPPLSHMTARSPGRTTLDEHDDLQDTDWSEFVSATPAGALESAQRTSSTTSRRVNEEVDLEADAGIQVRPGAFAIQGMDAANHDSESTFLNYNDEEGYSDNDNYSIRSGYGGGDPSSDFLVHGGGGIGGENGEIDLEHAAILLQGGALEAELYEPDILEGNIVEEEDEYDYATDPKLVRRFRMVQVMAVCFSLIGIVCVVMSAVSGFGTQTNDDPFGSEELPVITGWDRVGPQTFGPREKEDLVLFGSSVAMSSDGTRVVVTSPGADQGDHLNVGETYILEETLSDTVPVNGTEAFTTKWQVVYTLPGVGVNENPAASLTMSSDGSIMAVGYPQYNQAGIVQVFEEAQGWQSPITISYQQEYPPFGNEDEPLLEQENSTTPFLASAKNDQIMMMTGFGHSIDLSPDGTRLAVGAPLYEAQPGSVTGLVRVYQKVESFTNNATGSSSSSSSFWKRLGSNDQELLQGVHPNELFGWSVALRHNRVAVGAPAYDLDRGLVRVFEYISSPENQDGDDEGGDGLWRQVGSDIVGTEILHRFGESVALSQDGTILAVGARGSAFDPGQVQVFRQVKSANNNNNNNNNGQPEEETIWTADAQLFVGQEAGDGLGASVALSDDGHTLAMGAPESDEFGVDSGHVQVWQFHVKSRQWIQQGSNIGGTAGSNMGTSVALSITTSSPSITTSGEDNNGGENTKTNNIRVAGGAPGADFDGSVIQAGSIFVFDRHLTQRESQ
ncbi:hypothetical protein ACA910_020565 [Epithemia clementina (nom. ined.)]